MKKNTWFSAVIVLLVFIAGCAKNDTIVPGQATSTDTLDYPKKSMRGVWLPTVYGLDWPQGVYNVDQQKQQYINYLEKFKQLNINAVFFQIKGMGDATYPSSYEPWSGAITGTRGKDPGYDVLKFVLDEAHARNIEVHAWINPYRIGTRTDSTTPYPALHPSIKPEWVVSHEKIQIYNPAKPEVVQRLADIIKEVITKYNVDGIHFDDYFYPDPSAAGKMVSDQADFAAYGSGIATIEDFRRSNVDKAIKAVHDVIVATKPEVVFSVSPTPGVAYNYNTLYADVSKWCQQGWVDVVIPQLYQEIGNATSDFKERLHWWHQFSYQAMPMAGIALYRFGDGTSPSAFQTTGELEKQFNLIKMYRRLSGTILYSAKYLMTNKIGITDKIAGLWNTPAVIPFLGRAVAVQPVAPANVRVEGNTLKWSATGSVRSVVYYFSSFKAEGVVLAITNNQEFPVSANGYYVVTTLNADNMESTPSAPVNKQ